MGGSAGVAGCLASRPGEVGGHRGQLGVAGQAVAGALEAPGAEGDDFVARV
ncbi:hypothetical protein I6A60_24400 [Frankia sp. AgB1.9]|uniref:hypothetical protein n=1 Tax=unclassified Frankia TaxID=2632575 RepID=UPI0019342BA8|nr:MULTISPECIES: hypothetical protein [unclassified Frankia]MBL7494478.1 hypothetical protein [Frankia sp. AgW1.1]MBL7550982.1 hypothetical protein [Frankia sp. AgB1.9]MBL7623626.1 hypothetical protein [Frankia sp. AgB1.8]